MLSLLKNPKGMNIIGQGGKIMIFTFPSLILSLLAHIYLPEVASFPDNFYFIKPGGYVLLLFGLILWGTAVIQLLLEFPKGRLVTTGAYGIVRNPIYASATFLILPGVALITLIWTYLLVSLFLYLGVILFIGKEERQLAKAFGREYENYKLRVGRMFPFKKR